MRIAIRVDAGPLIGGGHAMRCLTLADVLAARGAEVTFITAAMPEPLCHRIVSSGHQFTRIPPLAELQREGDEWHEPPLDRMVQVVDATATGTASGPVEWMIVDHYLLDARWHSTARNFAQKLLVIDDLANRPYDCDLLLDQTFGRRAPDYAGLIPPMARLLAGPNFALLRPEFEQERGAAFNRRKEGMAIDRILISIGMSDVSTSTPKILDQVLATAPQCQIDVVLGPVSPCLQRLRTLAKQNANLNLHVDTREMARLTRDADLAIGAGGTAGLERCCLGLPAIILTLAENQRPNATALAGAGAAIAVDRANAIGPALRRLLERPDQLAQMSAAAFPIADGCGADRVASAVYGDEQGRSDAVELRPATHADMDDLWLWRNDPVTREQSRKADPVSWKSHVRWVSAALADPAHKIFIGERRGMPVGNVGFHQVEGNTEASIVVAPPERGKGVGYAMLRAACTQQRGEIFAAVRVANKASRRLFESCGFELVESNEPGFVRYLRRDEHPRGEQE